MWLIWGGLGEILQSLVVCHVCTYSRSRSWRYLKGRSYKIESWIKYGHWINRINTKHGVDLTEWKAIGRRLKTQAATRRTMDWTDCVKMADMITNIWTAAQLYVYSSEKNRKPCVSRQHSELAAGTRAHRRSHHSAQTLYWHQRFNDLHLSSHMMSLNALSA